MTLAPPPVSPGAPLGQPTADPSIPGSQPLVKISTPAVSGRPEAVTSAPSVSEADRAAMGRSGLPRWTTFKQRVLRNPVTYVVPALLIGYVWCILHMISVLVPDRQVESGTIPGLGTEAIYLGGAYALLTAVPLSLVFVMADRFRTQSFLPRLGLWALTFGWGAFVATAFSLELNTWMAGKLGVAGNGDPQTGARAAIFVAPFVEEFAKATVLFWIAILARYRWVSRLGAITMAGLSAAGFAFVENIIYYARIYRAAAQTSGAITPEAAITQLFLIRGVFSFFAHPLFTIMTVLGLAVALRTHSKVVRIIAPLTGFLGAALLHMAWNGFSSTMPDPMPLYWFVAIPLVMAIIGLTIREVSRQSKLLAARLRDYIMAGWLSQEEADLLTAPRRRIGLLWWTMFEHPVTSVAGPIAVVGAIPMLVLVWRLDLAGWIEFLMVVISLGAIGVSVLLPTPWLKTLRWIRAGTELGYLRDAMTKGLVDAAGHIREGELLTEMEQLRGQGVVLTPGKTRYVWKWISQYRQERRISAAPKLPARGQGSGTTYSAVDPNWAPPGS